MKTVVVANPKAANGVVGKHWSKYRRLANECFDSDDCRLTGAAGEATQITRQALEEGAERLVVVGGDGTMNETVNGLFDPDSHEMLNPDVSLAYLPAGTGGDFARSIGLSGKDLVKALADGTDRRIDLGRATVGLNKSVHHFINISSFGSSGLIVDKVNHTTKFLGGKASFMLGTVKGLMAYTNQRIRLSIDDSFDEEVLVNTVAVANGRYFGGSMKVAPDACLDDGQFDVVVIGDLNTAQFVRHSSKLYAGTHVDLDEVSVHRGKVVTAEPLGGEVLIDLDGEQPGALPVRYEVLPLAVQVFAPWSNAEAV